MQESQAMPSPSSSRRPSPGLRALQGPGSAEPAPAAAQRPLYLPEEGEGGGRSEILHTVKAALVVSGVVLGIGLLLAN
jgi:hypothetical protein